VHLVDSWIIILDFCHFGCRFVYHLHFEGKLNKHGRKAGRRTARTHPVLFQTQYYIKHVFPGGALISESHHNFTFINYGTTGHHWVPLPMSHSPNPHTNLLNVFIQIANNKGIKLKKNTFTKPTNPLQTL
jgi:hypothetical protein